jgi:zinc transporter 1
VGANAHGHSHDGAHGHGHGGDEEHHSHEEHGHSHEHKEKKKMKDGDEGHGHSHEEKKAKKAKEKGHGHSHGDEEGHSHEKKDKSKKKDKGHGHSHDDHAHDHDEHDHDSHSEEEHGHSHGDHRVKTNAVDDSIGINTSSSASSYQYGEATFLSPNEGEKELLLVASGSKKPKKHKGKTDHNIRAVFLHYLGDALSSLCVLATGLLYHFFPNATWTKYLDPISSLVIVALILFTTIPFVKSASVILLQRVPNEVSIPHLTEGLLRVEGVLDVHDLHVWQLVDKMIIASVHVRIETTDVDRCKRIMANAKAVFHRFGVHSCTMQPEFIPKGFITGPRPCSENCVDHCVEDWCCKAEEEILEFKKEYGSLIV